VASSYGRASDAGRGDCLPDMLNFFNFGPGETCIYSCGLGAAWHSTIALYSGSLLICYTVVTLDTPL